MTVNRDTISKAWALIHPHVIRTPVLTTNAFGREVSFKMEHMQHTGSFKARGAMNSVLTMDVPAAGLTAASGGNHGAAVAWAAAQTGHTAKIFVPDIAGPAKINLIKSLGADLEVVPGEYANAADAVAQYAAKTGAAQIHPFDATATLNGQGSVMAEWDDQGLDADTVLIAVGGGGLIGGAMAWIGDTRKVIGVEPHNAAALTRALENGPDTQVKVSGVAANALGARQIGRMCYDLAMDRQLETVLVTDDAITQAQHLLWSKLRQLVEPAGATALAALLSGAYEPEPDEKVAILLCGANPAPSPF